MSPFRINYSVINENLKLAVSSILANKMRAILTALGIIIGITTIISLLTLIVGLNEYVASTLSSFGTNTFYLMKFTPFIGSHEEFRKMMRRPRLELDDVIAIKEKCENVEFVSVRIFVQKRATYRDEETDYLYVVGVNETFQNMEDMKITSGRFLTEDDINHSGLVCVIGYDVKDALFGKKDPLGERIKVGGYPLKVVGTLGKLGSVFGQNRDNIVLLPVTTFKKAYGWNDFAMIIIKPVGNGSPIPAVEEVRKLMRQRHMLRSDVDDDFSIQTQEAMLGLFKSLTGVIFSAMIGVAFISLIVGGVGIMNILLVSITERTREIGIRKAVGAKRSDILGQFLFESAIISLIGGIFGLGLSVVLVRIISSLTGLPSQLHLWVILLGIGFAIAVGLVFGVYPANKAARMDPIYALRYE
ncbi:MAG: ABC transporter permease [bacterium]